MKQERIEALVSTIYQLRIEIKAINDLVVPPWVEKPKVCTMAQYQVYLEAKKAYDAAVYKKGEGLEKKELMLKEHEAQVRNMIPTTNTWFVTDNEKWAVAYRTNDWPSDPGDILIVRDPVRSELQEVRHQVIT